MNQSLYPQKLKKIGSFLWKKFTSLEFPLAVGGLTAYYQAVMGFSFGVNLLIAIGSYFGALGIVSLFGQLKLDRLPFKLQLVFYLSMLAIILLWAYLYRLL